MIWNGRGTMRVQLLSKLPAEPFTAKPTNKSNLHIHSILSPFFPARYPCAPVPFPKWNYFLLFLSLKCIFYETSVRRNMYYVWRTDHDNVLLKLN